ncbi:MAG: molybdate ABC transporter permease subunit [Sphingobacteriales bacterium]
MDIEFLKTLWITFKLAGLTTIILMAAGLPVAYCLAYCRFKLKPLAEALISMPMVLPPSVMGYYMLLIYSPRNAFGAWLAKVMNIRLAFSFPGILFASLIFSLPFMVQPLLSGLRSLPDSLSEAAYTLGKSKTVTFFRVLLPNVKPSFVTGISLTFAHCIGEFGLLLMVGGNIPGETRVASIAIYDEVQALNFKAANQYALILFTISFALLTLIYSVNKKNEAWKEL